MTVSSKSLPRISVVVPSFNQGHFLPETFDSLFCQNYPSLEVVVMDGGSTDNSVDIIRAHAHRLTHWQSQKDGGQSAAINAGVQRCTGDLVTWLNSDDYFWRDCLWTVGRAFLQHAGYGLYIGNGFRHDQASGRITPFCPRHVALNRTALVQGGDYLLQPSTFILREAWNEANGLDPDLHYCMDWDLFIRIAARRPAVLINEFLAVSREYEQTKTKSGNLNRAIELVRMIQGHTQEEVTPGTLVYLFDALLSVTSGKTHCNLKAPFAEASTALIQQMCHRYGGGSYFPEQSDPQDRNYVPIATLEPAVIQDAEFHDLPSMTMILLSLTQEHWLEQALESVLAQGYPSLQVLVVHSGASKQLQGVVERFAERVSFLSCPGDSGPVEAINRGLRVAQGDVMAWLDCRDRLACGALWAIGETFLKAPETDLILGNALFVDDDNNLRVIDEAGHRSAFLYGQTLFYSSNIKYWRVPRLLLPQPVPFFRRRLLGRCGYLNENYRFLGDREWIERCTRAADVRKLERTVILSRAQPGRWGEDGGLRAELYQGTRSRWPALCSSAFRRTYHSFINENLTPRLHPVMGGLRRWFSKILAKLSVLTGVGNPERLLPATATPALPPPLAMPVAPSMGAGDGSSVSLGDSLHEAAGPRQRDYHSICCFTHWPGQSPSVHAERDLRFLRQLVSLSTVEFFAVHGDSHTGRTDPLGARLESLHTPATIHLMHLEWLLPHAGRQKITSRIIRWLRRYGIPVIGPRYHLEVTEAIPHFQVYCRSALQQWLDQQPDFLFVSSQGNPAALLLNSDNRKTRLVLVAHNLESERPRTVRSPIRRLARWLEARRARRYEKDNLACYDGVIVASEQARDTLVTDYQFPAERVQVILSGADDREWDVNLSCLEDFMARLIALPRRNHSSSGPFCRLSSARLGTTRLAA